MKIILKKKKKKYEIAWNTLKSVDGVLVPGGFGSRGMEGKYLSSKYCRLNNKPYLGICLGMQTAIIDITKDYINSNATSEEFEEISNNLKKNEINNEKENSNKGILINSYESINSLKKYTNEYDYNMKLNNCNHINNVYEETLNGNNIHKNDYKIDNTKQNKIDQNCEIQTNNKMDNINEYLDKPLGTEILKKIKLLQINDFYKNIQEIDNDNVIISMPNFKGEEFKGGSMRLGLKETQIIDKDSLTYKLYDKANYVYERHRHRYEVNPKYVPLLESFGLSFVAKDTNSLRMEICEIKHLDFYLCVQFHPEFTSRPFKANPIFLAFVLASKGKLKERLKKYDNHLYPGITYSNF